VLPCVVAILWFAAGTGCADTPAYVPQAPPMTTPVTAATPSGVVTVVGTVEAGVEPRCLLLRQGERPYLLLGGDPAVVRLGAHIVVRGRPEPGRVTTCMQGVPFQVIEARPR
jgi:hypothetical protein